MKSKLMMAASHSVEFLPGIVHAYSLTCLTGRLYGAEPLLMLNFMFSLIVPKVNVVIYSCYFPALTIVNGLRYRFCT